MQQYVYMVLEQAHPGASCLYCGGTGTRGRVNVQTVFDNFEAAKEHYDELKGRGATCSEVTTVPRDMYEGDNGMMRMTVHR